MLTAKQISGLAVNLLTRKLVLPMTVQRVPGSEFSGPNGSTITVRVRQPRASREQSTPGADITFDSPDETAVSLTVAHLYSGDLLSDEDLTLNLEDFGRQILQPEVAAVATGGEDQLAGEMNGLDLDSTIEFGATPDPDADEDVVLAAREQLTSDDIPLGRRWLAVSPDIATRLLKIEKFVKANEAGSDSALRDAVIGRAYGFNVVESNAIDAGTAVAYEESGFVWVSRPPVSPASVDSATSTVAGVSLRAIRQYIPTKLSEASVVSTFSGAAAVHEDESGAEFVRAIRIGTASA
jgi:hypothetical protein